MCKYVQLTAIAQHHTTASQAYINFQCAQNAMLAQQPRTSSARRTSSANSHAASVPPELDVLPLAWTLAFLLSVETCVAHHCPAAFLQGATPKMRTASPATATLNKSAVVSLALKSTPLLYLFPHLHLRLLHQDPLLLLLLV